MSIKPENIYKYSLPEKLNINNKSILLFGGYPVNITSNGNKMIVKSNSYFAQELFRSLIGGNLDNFKEDDCLQKQDNYLSIYLYEQSLIRTFNILRFKIQEIISSKDISLNDFKEENMYKDIKQKYKEIINEYNSIKSQIQNYKILRRILKQNKCIIKKFYDIRTNLRSILNLEKIFIDNPEKVEKYKLYKLYNNNRFILNELRLELIEENNKFSISFSYELLDHQIFKEIDKWKNNKIFVANISITYLTGGHNNFLILFRNNNKVYALRIDPKNIIDNIIYGIKKLFNNKILNNSTSLENKIINSKDNYTKIYKQITIEDLNNFSEKYERLLSSNKNQDIIKLKEMLKKTYKNITINTFLKDKLKERDITFLNIFPNHGIQSDFEPRLSKNKLFSEKYYDFEGFCTIFAYYLTNEFIKFSLKVDEKLKNDKLEERILKVYKNIYNKISKDINKIDISDYKYPQYVQEKLKNDKLEIKKLIWVSNISKNLTQFRNQIIPFGVSDNNLVRLFLKRYYHKDSE
jgi:uncharacterized protein YeaO (DUF488 family)